VLKKVLVAGGGVAGMQAALTARRRGHQVILCEKSGRLGGILLCEEGVPFKKHLAEYLRTQALLCQRAGVDIRLNTEVTPAYALSLKPDVIIAALGAKPLKPSIPGIDGGSVLRVRSFLQPRKGRQEVAIIGAACRLELAFTWNT
jgi:NADPH-dependent 2,4-dienoyl-CoA reductase/sulfur reductase-like enzyme